jgi:hypothetical protein
MTCVILLLLVRSAPAQDTASEIAAPVASETGTLMLGVESALDASSKRLNVNVHPSGKATVSGGADVVGFPIIDSGQWGDVNWTVNGAQVTGTVRNRSGEVEGMFDGTITATGVSGKFTHVDGRVGLWSWDGPPPAAAAQP